MTDLNTAAASRVHFANDNERISLLAEAMYRQRHDGTAEFWRSMTLDDQRALRMEARDWIRAAVAAGILPAPVGSDASSLSSTPLAVAFGAAIPTDTVDTDEESLLTILEEGVHDGPVFVSVLSSIDGGPDFADYCEATDTALVDRLLEWKNNAVQFALRPADDIQRPCTRCGDLNHASRDCEAEDPYEGMTNADVMTYEELDADGRDAEFRLDAADDARWGAEQAAEHESET
jgi:hypothetical protein